MKKTLSTGLTAGVLVLGLLGTAQAIPVQWEVSAGGNGHWYEIVSSGQDGSWLSAENNAVAKGGHLVSFASEAEELWVQMTFSRSTRYWIGFTDAVTEGAWQWSSGEAVTYTNWATGEPNNAMPPAEGEDFAVMNWNSTGWNDWSHLRPDYPCKGIDGIAEYSPVPEPATMLLFGVGLSGLVAARRRKRG